MKLFTFLADILAKTMLLQKVVSVSSHASSLSWRDLREYLGGEVLFELLGRYTKGDGRWPKRGVVLYLYGKRDSEGRGVTSPFKTFVARAISRALLNGNDRRTPVYLKSPDLRVREGMPLDKVLVTMRRAITADLLVIDDVQLVDDDPHAQSKLVDIILDRRRGGGFLILTGTWNPQDHIPWADDLSAVLSQRSFHEPVKRPRSYASARSAS